MTNPREHTKPSGERIEDVVEGIVSAASPTEHDTADGGTEGASRNGDEALDDDSAFSA